MEEVFRLYQEKYFDLSVRHFHEKLREVEQIQSELQLGETSAARDRAGEETAEKRGPTVLPDLWYSCPGEPAWVIFSRGAWKGRSPS